jgi:hypothetical protein
MKTKKILVIASQRLESNSKIKAGNSIGEIQSYGILVGFVV